MNRYRFPIREGEASRTMEMCADGPWVLHSSITAQDLHRHGEAVLNYRLNAAAEYLDTPHERFSQRKMYTADELQTAVHKARTEAYREGGDYVQQRLDAERKETDKLNKQLLNELYHDRSRLERAVKDACAVMDTLTEVVSGGSVFTKDGSEMSIEEAESFALGLSQEFVDTHDID